MLSDFNLLAHVEAAARSSLPVYGNFYTALIGLILVLAAVGIFYLIVTKLPVSKHPFSFRQELALAKIITGLVLATAASGSWDVWWHRGVGRDSLWELPHLFLYSFASMAILCGVYGWHKTHNKVWKRIAAVLILVPVTAPFDNFWHVLYGVEDLSRPISLSWSPPHMLLDLGGLLALVFLWPVLRRDPDEGQRSFFINLNLAVILPMLLFLVMPFHPTEGWGQVAGFWGAGVIAAMNVLVMAAVVRLSNGSFDAVKTVAYGMILILIGFGKETAPGIILFPHDRPPIWLYALPLIISGIVFDVTKGLPAFLRGAMAGGVWSAILFFASPSFFEAQFRYPLVDAIPAVIASIIAGGLVATLVANFDAITAVFRRKSKILGFLSVP